MARVITTGFTYQNQKYTAVLSQVDGHINVYVPDERLHKILPAGKTSFKTDQGIKIDTPRLTPAQNLLLSILSTVDLNAGFKLKVDEHVS